MSAERLLIAGICLPFLFSAFAKLADFDGAVAECSAAGLPLPALVAALTIALQLGASAAVVALPGAYAAAGALALAFFTVAATLLVHRRDTRILVEHLSIAFALVFVAWWDWRLHGAV